MQCLGCIGTDVPEMLLGNFEYIGYLNSGGENVLTKVEIAKEMLEHPVWKQLLDYVKNGWPEDKKEISKELKVFYKFRQSLDCEDNCIYFGDRILVPSKHRGKVLEMLHREHIGVARCKMLARKSVWWPGVSQDVEKFVINCDLCNKFATRKANCKPQKWTDTVHPMERIHIDHFMLNGSNYLIIADDYSGWVDIQKNSSVSTRCVLHSLRIFFATFGLPKKIVSDNGSSFTSEQFRSFCVANSIEHILTPPYHPMSNGLAERAVGIAKQNLKKFMESSDSSNLSVEEQIQNYLFKSRSTPLSSPTKEGKSPSELILSFKMNTPLNLLQRSKNSASLPSQQSQPVLSPWNSQPNQSLQLHPKADHPYHEQRVNSHSRTIPKGWTSNRVLSSRQPSSQIPSCSYSPMSFKVGDTVWFRHGARGVWLKGVLLKKLSNFVYEVEGEGVKMKIHQDSLKKREKAYEVIGLGQVPGEFSPVALRTRSRMRRNH